MTGVGTTPLEIVQQYFSAMRAGDERVAELFTHDAELVGLGTVVSGRPAIEEFYRASIAAARPSPRLVGPCMVAGDRVAAEIVIDLADAPSLHVMDLFEVEDDRIRRLSYFLCDRG